jgi:lipopolysaccharide export system protein LptA
MTVATQTGTKTLRRVLVGSAVVLLAVVGGFIFVGRLKTKNWLMNLPKKLGVDIQQESNNFTWSQSVKGKKIFTVHASKEAQMKNGKMALHDVGIVLYGPTGAETDKIHGADFEYDQKNGILTAQGEVYIDLAPPPAKPGEPVKPVPAGEEDPRTVHVKTIGLVYRQKEQMATSVGAVEFRTGGYTGNSMGATYDSKDGVVVLQSQVRMSGLRPQGGTERPVVVTATRAEMDRKSSVVDLQTAKYSVTGEHGTQTASAVHAVVHTAPDGTPQAIDAEGTVTLVSSPDGKGGGTVVSDKLNLELGPKGQARAAHLFGNVHYTSDENQKREDGRAQDAKIAFDDEGRPVHALMAGGVTFVEQGPASGNDLQAANVELVLAGGGKAPVAVRSATAWGAEGARMKLASEDQQGRHTTDVKADRLTGRFNATALKTELTGLDGFGHSWVQRTLVGPTGTQVSRDTSTGAVLHADFKPGDVDSKERVRSELTRAEQEGDVVSVHEAIVQKGPNKGQLEVEHARAEDSVYEADKDLVHMTGAVEIQDATSALFADKVDVDRGTGDAVAVGAVRVNYVQAAKPSTTGPGEAPPATPQEPVHVLAVRAVAHKQSGLAEFFGDGAERARMWQGASQVEAPVLDFYQKEKRLVARGEPGSTAASVRTVLVNANAPAAPAGAAAPASTGAKRKQGSGGPVRIVSQEMIYTDSARTVEFDGAVWAVDADGTLTSKAATVWLTPAQIPGQKGLASVSSGFMGGRVDHMMATGNVVIDQPGRRGTGEKLVYTASDGEYVLTGTKAAPPRVVDETQGTTTGAALRFRSGDDSVEVLGAADAKAGGQVHTETRMKQQ